MIITDNIRSFNSKLWSHYRLYTQSVMEDESFKDKKVMQYWRNKLFINAMMLALPISLIAVIPSIIIELKSGFFFLVTLDIVVLATLAFLVLNRKISLHFRKLSISVLITVFSVLLLAIMGSFGMGSIYLFSLSIIIALIYPGKAAFAGVLINLIICSCFALILNYRLFSLPILSTMKLDRWLLYSVNFLFMDLVLIAMITQLLNGLERVITKKSILYKWLEKELNLKNTSNVLLRQSEAHYKTLFSQSPLSICVYDRETLEFLQVNEAATHIYDYTEQEFLTMRLHEIQSQESLSEGEHVVFDQANKNNPLNQQMALHVKKDGRLIHVEIKCSDYIFQGKQARLMIATDITQKVDHINAIKKQNEKLKEIAFLQSHVIRVPLANIMGLSNLIMEEAASETQIDLLNYLNVSVKQLDAVIRDIVNDKE